MQFKDYLRPEAFDLREVSIAASSYCAEDPTVDRVTGGVKNGTLFCSRGGNLTPADCKSLKMYRNKNINLLIRAK